MRRTIGGQPQGSPSRVVTPPRNAGLPRAGISQFTSAVDHNHGSWVFDVTAYGATGNGNTDDTTAIQRAVTAATTIINSTKSGGIVFFPPGLYKVSSAITISRGCMLIGSGTGSGSGSGNTGGTVIRTSSATADVFEVTGVEAVIFRDFWTDASVTRTAGAGIKFTGSGTSTNNRSRIYNVSMRNHFYGIHVLRAQGLVIDSCWLQDFAAIGIYFEQDDATDDGDNVVTNCVIWDLNLGTTQAGIRYDKGGTLTIAQNKILGTDYGIRLILDAGPTGTMIIQGNSLEEQDIIGILVEQATLTVEYAYLLIQGNQLQQTTNPVSLQSAISIVSSADADPWIAYVTIADNVIAWGSSRAFNLISVQDGEFVIVANNILTALGNAGPGGITVGGSALDVKIFDNVWTGIPTGIYSSGLTSTTVLKETLQGIAYASVGGWGNGSEIYVTDGQDNNQAVLTSGGVGITTKRENGVWVTQPVISTGTYTPTRSAEANLDANVTPSQAQYNRTGKVVTVSGRFTANPTAGATATSFELSLPVSSNLGAVEDLAGVAFCGAIAGQGAAIVGSVANNTAVVQWVSGDLTDQTWSYTFQYEII